MMTRVYRLLPEIRRRLLVIGNDQQLTEVAALLSDDARQIPKFAKSVILHMKEPICS